MQQSESLATGEGRQQKDVGVVLVHGELHKARGGHCVGVIVKVLQGPEVGIGARDIVEVFAVGEREDRVDYYGGKVAETLGVLVAVGAYGEMVVSIAGQARQRGRGRGGKGGAVSGGVFNEDSGDVADSGAVELVSGGRRFIVYGGGGDGARAEVKVVDVEVVGRVAGDEAEGDVLMVRVWRRGEVDIIALPAADTGEDNGVDGYEGGSAVGVGHEAEGEYAEVAVLRFGIVTVGVERDDEL